MEQFVKCPICGKYDIKVKVPYGYEVDFDRPLSEHKLKTVCVECNKIIKYSVKKTNKAE
jgi:hypothetical protein